MNITELSIIAFIVLTSLGMIIKCIKSCKSPWCNIDTNTPAGGTSSDPSSTVQSTPNLLQTVINKLTPRKSIASIEAISASPGLPSLTSIPV